MIGAQSEKRLAMIKKEQKGEQVMIQTAVVKLSFLGFIILFRIFPGILLLLLAGTALFLNRQLLY